MNILEKVIEAIELHAVEEIQDCFQQGLSPNETFNHQPLIYELISEYTRTPRFKDCVKVFMDHGLIFEDQALLSVLMDDALALNNLIASHPEMMNKKYSLRCAYTPFHEVNLLHICAEFNHVACAEVLVRHGVNVNVRAGVDEHGFGGQTSIFHTVNQNSNNSKDMLDFLLSHSADLTLTVKGLIWGKGYPWETLVPSVNPISYCMMGLLPQMHREEKTISDTVSRLLKAVHGIEYQSTNIPNHYLSR